MITIELREAVVVEARRSKDGSRTYAEFRCGGSAMTVRSEEVDLCKLPLLEKVSVVLEVETRVYRGEKGPITVIEVKSCKPIKGA